MLELNTQAGIHHLSENRFLDNEKSEKKLTDGYFNLFILGYFKPC